MQIMPINQAGSIAELSKTELPSGTSNGLPFQSLFEDAVSNVKETNSNLNQELYKLTTGQSDNLHDITIASQKATLSVDLLVQMRNKVLDAYNEVMRMNV